MSDICTVTYQGPSNPDLHGTRCIRQAPHDGLRHFAVVDDIPLTWWTEEEKKVIRARRAERAQENA